MARSLSVMILGVLIMSDQGNVSTCAGWLVDRSIADWYGHVLVPNRILSCTCGINGSGASHASGSIRSHVEREDMCVPYVWVVEYIGVGGVTCGNVGMSVRTTCVAHEKFWSTVESSSGGNGGVYITTRLHPSTRPHRSKRAKSF